jgi:hypothetical protein
MPVNSFVTTFALAQLLAQILPGYQYKKMQAALLKYKKIPAATFSFLQRFSWAPPWLPQQLLSSFWGQPS